MSAHRPLAVAGVLFAVLAGAAAIAAGLAYSGFQRAGDYPGARLVSSHSLYSVTPHLNLRIDASYRTNDKFPKVYNWYSQRFSLGPEAAAHSSCITLERAGRVLGIIERTVGVTLCETAAGRLVFVQRTITVRYRR